MKRLLTISVIAIIIFVLIGAGTAFSMLFFGGGSVNLQKGLVGNWKFDGNAKDATPNANNGTLNGDAAVTANDRKGQSNKALTLDGTGDYVAVTDADIFSFGDSSNDSPFSISAWINRDVSAVQGIVQKGTSHNVGEYNLDFDGTTLWFRVVDNSASAFLGQGVANAVSTGVWSYIVATYDGSKTTGGIKIYINGALASMTEGTQNVYTAMENTTNNLEIGKYRTGDYFDGSIDDVRIYNRALSTTEITALYQSYDPGVTVATTQKSLVAHWKFDGNAKDATPQANNGTVTGAVLTTDRKGQSNKAYDFDGTDDNVSVANESNFDFERTSPFSFSAWIKSDVAAVAQYILSKGDSSDGLPGYRFQVQSVDKLGFEIGNTASGGNRINTSTNSTFDFTTWRHVAVTYTGSSNAAGVKLYVDGVSYAHTAADDALVSSTLNNESFVIGNLGPTAANPFNGKIDDVRVYNRALSATEITAMYESYNSIVAVSTLSRGLVGRWLFDGNAKDATPQGNNGTVTGATLTTDRKGQSNKAYDFDSSAQYVSVGTPWDNIVGAGTTNLSMSVWVKGDAFTAGDHWITSDHNAGGDSSSLGMSVSAQKANFIAYCAAGYVVESSTTTLSDNVWYHLVGTYDGANSRLYVNGVQEDADAQTCTLFNSVTAASIGRPGAYSGGSFVGQIDDMRVWNRALSATEITALYESYR